MKPKYKRLPKGPGEPDYCVQVIDRQFDKERTWVQFFMDRKEARAYAKEQHKPGIRVRIFSVHFVLDQDLK